MTDDCTTCGCSMSAHDARAGCVVHGWCWRQGARTLTNSEVDAAHDSFRDRYYPLIPDAPPADFGDSSEEERA